MTNRFFVFILITILLNSLCYAEMYIWVDKNGVKHFTDTPPNSNDVSPEQVKQSESAEYAFSHRLYKKTGDIEYCGDYRLPDRKNKDSEQLLEKIERVYKNARDNRQSFKDKLTSDYGESYRTYQQDILDEYTCIMEWATEVIKELKQAKP